MLNPMKTYRCLIGDREYGPLDESALRKLPGFTLHTLVIPSGEISWRPAYKVIPIAEPYDWSMVPGVGRVLDLGVKPNLL
jgi:hypothetical protein